MKTIIAGGRFNVDVRHLHAALEGAAKAGITVTELVCGMARGVDTMGYDWAKARGTPIAEFPAPWDDLTMPGAVVREGRDGKPYNAAAGPLRNQAMANYAQALIAIWDGQSTGTGDMIRRANARGLKVYIHRVPVMDRNFSTYQTVANRHRKSLDKLK